MRYQVTRLARRLTGAAFVVIAGLLPAACKDNPVAPQVPATLTLAIGQTATAGDARVTFVSVVSDSRCPMNAMCIQAGDVVIRLGVVVDGRQTDHDLALADPARRAVTYRQHLVELRGVEPFPFAGQTTPAGDIRATVEIRRP